MKTFTKAYDILYIYLFYQHVLVCDYVKKSHKCFTCFKVNDRQFSVRYQLVWCVCVCAMGERECALPLKRNAFTSRMIGVAVSIYLILIRWMLACYSEVPLPSHWMMHAYHTLRRMNVMDVWCRTEEERHKASFRQLEMIWVNKYSLQALKENISFMTVEIRLQKEADIVAVWKRKRNVNMRTSSIILAWNAFFDNIIIFTNLQRHNATIQHWLTTSDVRLMSFAYLFISIFFTTILFVHGKCCPSLSIFFEITYYWSEVANGFISSKCKKQMTPNLRFFFLF